VYHEIPRFDRPDRQNQKNHKKSTYRTSLFILHRKLLYLRAWGDSSNNFLIREKQKNMGQDEKNDVFDVRRVRRLVELMQDNDLTEIDLRQGEMRIQLKKDSKTVFASPPVSAAFPPVAAPAAVPPAAIPAAAPEAVVDESHVAYIKSPMVGTFYTAANPQSPPFVKVGDSVHPEKTVCILEAMKVFNEIQAEMTGKILAVLVANGEPVEFGKPLFKVDTKG